MLIYKLYNNGKCVGTRWEGMGGGLGRVELQRDRVLKSTWEEMREEEESWCVGEMKQCTGREGERQGVWEEGAGSWESGDGEMDGKIKGGGRWHDMLGKKRLGTLCSMACHHNIHKDAGQETACGQNQMLFPLFL